MSKVNTPESMASRLRFTTVGNGSDIKVRHGHIRSLYGKRKGRYVGTENAVRTDKDVIWEQGTPLG